MGLLLVILPLLFVLLTIFIGLVHALFSEWLNYRAKLALLDKIEKNPDMMRSASEIQAAVASVGRGKTGRAGRYDRQDYAVTGLLLGGIGVACILTGRYLRIGQLAVGLYLGGVVCAVMGVVLGLLGLLIRTMAKDPTARLGKAE